MIQRWHSEIIKSSRHLREVEQQGMPRAQEIQEEDAERDFRFYRDLMQGNCFRMARQRGRWVECPVQEVIR